MKTITDVNKFYTMTPMRYYDCGGNYQCEKAQAMIQDPNHECIATWKSDGEWCRAIINENGDVTLQSRGISKVTGEYGDKTALVPHVVEVLEKYCDPLTVLIGELCFEDIATTAKDVGSILRCLPAKAIARQQAGKRLVFKVFDCLAWQGQDLMDEPYSTRFAAAEVCIGNLACGYQDVIKMCKWTADNFEDFVTDILSAGGEGIVIHRKDYLYAPGGRPAWKTLKVKKTTGDIEVPVVDFIEPNRAYEGDNPLWEYQIDGEFVTKPYYFGWKNGVVVNHNGNLVRVTSGVTDADREWLTTDAAKEALANGTLIAVVSGMEITPDSIRHPRLIRLRTEA